MSGMHDRRGAARPQEGPTSPWQLARSDWSAASRSALKEFQKDAMTVWAAALTYYGVLSIFPGLLVLVSLLALLGQAQNIDALTQIVPGPSGQLLGNAANQLRGAGSTATVVAVIGVLVAFWSASGYVSAFMQASNIIYDVPERRPMWRKIPVRLALTAFVGLLLIVVVFILVFTAGIAQRFGSFIGLSSGAVTVWAYVKWPVLIVLVGVLFAVLYRAAPNVRHGRFRWVTPGSVLAVVGWIVLSALFSVYVATVASYGRTYGSISSVIVFLVWLWLSNLALLAGAEFDSELERRRAIAGGVSPSQEPFLEPRADGSTGDGGAST
jgi:membrane protein